MGNPHGPLPPPRYQPIIYLHINRCGIRETRNSRNPCPIITPYFRGSPNLPLPLRGTQATPDPHPDQNYHSVVYHWVAVHPLPGVTDKSWKYHSVVLLPGLQRPAWGFGVSVGRGLRGPGCSLVCWGPGLPVTGGPWAVGVGACLGGLVRGTRTRRRGPWVVGRGCRGRSGA